jgi:1-deoxy-D-xylulose-5-phosphate reductoisomerase
VHGLVHYADGSVLAQLACPDMRVPIAHALAWPARMATTAARLDLAALGRLEFLAPDTDRFPALKLAYAALRAGAGAPTVLNAANEAAVAAFLAGRCNFLAIVDAVAGALDALGAPPVGGLDEVFALDEAARRCAVRALDRAA